MSHIFSLPLQRILMCFLFIINVRNNKPPEQLGYRQKHHTTKPTSYTLWPIWSCFVANMVFGRYRCGWYGIPCGWNGHALWPIWLWPTWFVADVVCGWYGIGPSKTSKMVRRLHRCRYLKHFEHSGVGRFNAANIEMLAVLFSQSVHELGIWSDVTVRRRHRYDGCTSFQTLGHCRRVHWLDEPRRVVVDIINHYRHSSACCRWHTDDTHPVLTV